MQRVTLPVPSDRSLRVLKYVVAIATGIAIVALIFAFVKLSQRIDAADGDRAVLQQANELQDATIGAQADALAEANERLANAGETPVVPPPIPAPVVSEPGEPGATGSRGPAGPAGPAGESIIGPRGPVGPPGNDGKSGPPGPPGGDGQSVIGPVGPSGKDGQAGKEGDNGKDGQDGQVGPPGPKGEPGVNGPPGKDGATGPSGEPGRDGADSMVPGPPGRGITSVSCDSVTPMTLTVTYSDGSSETYTCATPVTERR